MRTLSAYIITLFFLLHTSSFAQTEMGSIPMWTTIGNLNTTILNNSLDRTSSKLVTDSITRRIAYGKTVAPSKEGDSEDASEFKGSQGTYSTVLKQKSPPILPGKLAAGYPEHIRKEAHHTFSELLIGYAKIEQQFKIPSSDVAGAVAAFIAGSYMAYRDVDFPDERFPPLVSQIRSIIQSQPEFAKATAIQKQEMYEQMAILGMFMATTRMALQERPNPQLTANLRQAAKSNLEQFLKTDADKVKITAQGLVIQ